MSDFPMNLPAGGAGAAGPAAAAQARGASYEGAPNILSLFVPFGGLLSSGGSSATMGLMPFGGTVVIPPALRLDAIVAGTEAELTAELGAAVAELGAELANRPSGTVTITAAAPAASGPPTNAELIAGGYPGLLAGGTPVNPGPTTADYAVMQQVLSGMSQQPVNPGPTAADYAVMQQVLSGMSQQPVNPGPTAADYAVMQQVLSGMSQQPVNPGPTVNAPPAGSPAGNPPGVLQGGGQPGPLPPPAPAPQPMAQTLPQGAAPGQPPAAVIPDPAAPGALPLPVPVPSATQPGGQLLPPAPGVVSAPASAPVPVAVPNLIAPLPPLYGTPDPNGVPYKLANYVPTNDLFKINVGEMLILDAYKDPKNGLLSNDGIPGQSLNNFEVKIIPGTDKEMHGDLYVGMNGSVAYTPDPGFQGKVSFNYTFRENDLYGSGHNSQWDKREATVTIEVVRPDPVVPATPVAQPAPPAPPAAPVPPPASGSPVAGNDFYAVKHGVKLEVDAANGLRANDTDPDGDVLSYRLADDPFSTIMRYGSLTLNPDGSFTYVPQDGAAGTEQVQVKVTDGINTTYSLLTIVVGNAQPKAENDSYDVSPGRTTFISAEDGQGVLANDTDADDDKLSASLVGGELIQGQDRLTTEKGLVIMTKSGTFSYTPHAGVTNGTDTFQYAAEDGFGGVSIATVTVRIVNQAPVAQNDAYGVGHGKPLKVDAAAGLLANDADPEGGKLTVENAGKEHRTAQDGVVTYAADGSFTYTPPKDFIGTDSFLYTVSDPLGALGLAGVTIKVGNSDPVLKSFGFSMAHDRVISIDGANGLLQGATDADGDPVKAIAHDKPTEHGHVWIFESGAFIYKPDAGFVGKDAFGFAAVDGFGGIGLGSISINVTNAAPAAQNDTYAVNAGGTLQTSVFTGLLSNDGGWKDGAFRDADGDALSVATIGLPWATAHGSVTVNADGSFSYTPDRGFAGLDYFSYTARDGFGKSTDAVAVIRVDNNPPVAENFGFGMTAGAFRLDVDVTNGAGRHVSDPDGDPVTIVGFRDLPTAQGGTATMNADGSFSYTPKPGFTGTDTFTYGVTDGKDGGSAQGTIVIVVGSSATVLPPAVVEEAVQQTGGTGPVTLPITGGPGGGTTIPVTGIFTPPAEPGVGEPQPGAGHLPGYAAHPGSDGGDGIDAGSGGPGQTVPPPGAAGGGVPGGGLPGSVAGDAIVGGGLVGGSFQWGGAPGGWLPGGRAAPGDDHGTIILPPGSGRGPDDVLSTDHLSPADDLLTALPPDDAGTMAGALPAEDLMQLHRVDLAMTGLLFA
jgi:hypothetical protein